jgi:hypothetical protein
MGPQLLQGSKAVELGQIDVKDDQVIGWVLAQPEALFPVEGQINGISFLLKSFLHEIGYFLLIFHYQDSHVLDPRRERMKISALIRFRSVIPQDVTKLQ